MFETQWNKPGDACPNCGSTKTGNHFEQEVKWIPQMRLDSIPLAHHPIFEMYCRNCGHNEVKQGYPGHKKIK